MNGPTLRSHPLLVSPRSGTTKELVDRVRTAVEHGVDEVWLDQQPDAPDALVTAAALLTAVPTVHVGTAVLPLLARHPVALAQSAATLAEMSGGRFRLGVGISHRFVNEFVLGQRQGPVIGVVREHLHIARSLLNDGVVSFEGQHVTARAEYVGLRTEVPVYLAALRPQMIRLAVKSGASGILLWLCSPRYAAERVLPVVREACEEVGRNPSDFDVLAMTPACCGDHLDEQRAGWAATVASYRMLPAYRHVLEAFGEPDPEELCLFGARDEVRERADAYRAAGCTPLPSTVPGAAPARTLDALYG